MPIDGADQGGVENLQGFVDTVNAAELGMNRARLAETAVAHGLDIEALQRRFVIRVFDTQRGRSEVEILTENGRAILLLISSLR